MSRATSYHRERPMSHPAPSNAEPIRLTATQSHREARNSLISSALELNLMPFGQEHDLCCNILRGLFFRWPRASARRWSIADLGDGTFLASGDGTRSQQARPRTRA